jgi:hypothetical protein
VEERMMNQNEAQRSRVDPDKGSTEEDVAIGALDPKEVLGMVAGFARENPHAALASACALGFLLGGGLTPRLLGGIALFAGRKYFNQTVRETLEGVLREQLGSRQGL